MPRSRLSLPLRLTLRGARVALRTTRDVADLGLAVVDFAGRALGETEPVPDPVAGFEPVSVRRSARPQSPPPSSSSADGAPGAPLVGSVATLGETEEVIDVPDDLVDVDGLGDDEPAHVDADVELVDEVADPGAEDGAGASIRIAPPVAGYDALRAPDVIALVGGADAATLAAIELYEQTHRARRTVLDAVARAARRQA